ncbi:hypothetical protein J2X47_001937 [Sphingomonas sp. BE270]|jgi:hypothetical protein|nr:hypothetical protein [Sphingomonas sp. BE270]MDR7257757.1 hypothetical protein [Sphingomonas sp. BE270]
MTQEAGWIEWAGGECPVEARTSVVCKLRNGHVMRRAMAKARDWRHSRSAHWDYADIIAYRVVPA